MSGFPRAFLMAGLVLSTGLLPAPVRAQEICPAAGNNLTAEGWDAYRSNDRYLARERFTQALGLCPYHLGARIGLAYVALREGKGQEATSRFETLLIVSPQNIDVLVGLGILAWRSGELEAVAGYFSKVLDLDPQNSTAAEYLQRLPAELRPAGVPAEPPPEVADPEAQRPQDVGPEDEISPVWDPGGAHQEASEAWAKGDTEEAASLYDEILAADSTDGLALNRLALISGWEGDYTKALSLFDHLLVLEPTNYDAAVSRARVLAWRGDNEEALESLDRILAADPGNLQALEARAQIQSWAGAHTASLSSYQELLGLSDDPAGILLAQARVLGSASRVQEARIAYEEVLARDSGNLEALKGLAQTLTWSGFLPEGEEAWRKALGEASQDPVSRAGLAHNLRWQGRNLAALEVLNRAAPGQGDHPELQGQLAWVDAALAPRAWVTLVREGDSDDNAMTTAQFRGRQSPRPNLDLYGVVYVRDLDQDNIGLFRSSWGVNIDATYHLEPGWVINAGAGGNRTDGSGTSSFTSLRAGLATPARNRVGGSIQLTRYPLDVTAQLVERGVRVSSMDLAGRWTPHPGWQVTGTAGLGAFRGEDQNHRVRLDLQVTRGMRGGWTLGLSHRYFGFDEDLDEFYFDPDYFGLTEVMARGSWDRGPWGFLVELSPGAQKISSRGVYKGAVRSSARVSYRFDPGREVSISGGYSSAGLQSFNTSGSDYRYRALILGGSWIF